MKRALVLLATAAFVSAVPASSSLAAQPQADTVDTRVPTQLPRTAVPHHYAITLTPHADRLVFDATVAIDLDVVQADAHPGPECRRPEACIGHPDPGEGRSRPDRAHRARRAGADRHPHLPERTYATAPTGSTSAIRARSTRRRTACSRSITRTRKARTPVRCSRSSKPPTPAASCPAGTSPTTRRPST